MLNKTAIAVAALILVACSSPPADPSVQVETALPATVPAPILTDDPVSLQAMQYRHLRDHVLTVMTSWPKGSKELPTADCFDVASDIAAAVIGEPAAVEMVTGKPCSTVRGSDRCFWGSGLDSDGAKSVLLAALAYWEGTRFAAYADESLCTDKAWRASETGRHFMHIGGDCDGGHAWALWQIHPIEAKDVKGSHIDGICDVEHVSESRFGAARCALELARESMAQRDNLAQYTGEIGGYHPKADERLDFARVAIKKHPWVE
jgi:hypothetical protein